MVEEKCKYCKFWLKRGKLPDKMDVGKCRRYPKTFTSESKIPFHPLGLVPKEETHWLAKFPTMKEDEWCGEFKEKEAESKGAHTKGQAVNRGIRYWCCQNCGLQFEQTDTYQSATEHECPGMEGIVVVPPPWQADNDKG